MSKTVFLTGITGTLGKEILKHFLLSTENRIICLIRRKNRLTHWDRIRKILAAENLEHHLGVRVEAFDGDLTEPSLGMNPQERTYVVTHTDEIYHIAAVTELNAAEELCQRVNYEGTLKVLDLAKECRSKGTLQRFFYFSTAYTPGSRQTYCSYEDVLPEKPAHANFYESSKYRSESEVRKEMKQGLPTTILRPSIIVGDSTTGKVSDFNVIYPFIRMFAHGFLQKLPSRPENSFNIVPIDFVVQASMHIASLENSLGKTYHLVTKNPPSLGMLLELRDQEFPQMPPVELVDPAQFEKNLLAPQEQMVYEMLSPYLGYLNDHLTFDSKNTEEILRDSGIKFPDTGYEFLKTLVRFAVDSGYILVSS